MCGIAGLYRPRNGLVSPQEMTSTVAAMTGSLAHRGPDGEGLWTDPEGRCVLGHRRLSIIDTSAAGTQPMLSGNGRYVTTFNGELYNFAELRAPLAAAGVALKGRTDTEVLIEAVGAWGVEALSRFDGMFAFAVFDTLSGDLILARDPFGEKPLYHTRLRDGTFAFASELQALERVAGFDPRISIDAMAEMLTFQYIGAPRSIYQSVRKLRPGHWMRIEASGRVTSGRYFQFQPGVGGFSDRSLPDLADELEELLAGSLRRRLIADVPLGAFLSGGVDSATTCALIAGKLGRPLMTFSMGFDNAAESEHLTAQTFAEHLRTEHRAQVLSPDVAGFLSEIGSVLDEPNGDSSCLPTFMLSRYARQHVTVAISGDGGDEMFGGYGRYQSTLAGQARYRAGEAPGWKPGWAYYGDSILVAAEAEIERLFGSVPRAFADHLGTLRTEIDDGQDQLLCELRRTDVDNYMPGAVLPKVDRMSMRNSLEVRTPFLSVDIARFAERLPDTVLIGDRAKLILREVAYRYLPRPLIDLPKQGFALPMSDWARADLLAAARELLGGNDGRLRAAFGSSGIDALLERQETPGQFSPYQLWGVVTLESWLRNHRVELESTSQESLGYFGGAERVESSTFVLRAAPVRPGLFLVARADARSTAPIAPGAVHPDLMIRAIELSSTGPVGTGEATIDLPPWGAAREADIAAHHTAFAGATLIFLDADAALRFGAEEAAWAQAIGLSRAVFRKPHGGAGIVELEFRSRTRLRRLADFAVLLSRRVATLSSGGWLKGIPGVVRLRPIGGKALRSGLLRATDPIPDEELSSRFMLFQGMRQLPPLPAGHAMIEEEGDGRYSVFDQSLTVAPSRRGGRGPFWLVRADRKTLPHLPITVREDRIERLSLSATQRLFGNARANPAEEPPARLSPGDRVVVCTHALPPGGAERQWVYLAQALQDAGFAVVFVCYQPLEHDNAHYLPALLEAGIPVIEAARTSVRDRIEAWPKSSTASALLRSAAIPEWDAVFGLAAAFAAVRPQAVFSQLDEPNLLAGFAAELVGVPLHVMSFRNFNPTRFPYLNKDWYAGAYRLLAGREGCVLTGNHPAANRDYAHWIGVDPERVHHVPNVIDPAAFPSPAPITVERVRRDLEIPEGTPVIFGALRLSAEKEPLTFVEVCAAALEAVPGARALLAGVGPLAPSVIERVEQLGMGDRISILGSRPDVNVLLSLATLCLLTSRIEGTPNILMEAQLAGVPVVATRVGGVADIVAEGVSARLFEADDVAGLAAACAALLKDPTAAHEMGVAGRRHVLSAFRKDRLVDNYLMLINGDTAPPPGEESNGNDALIPVGALSV